MRAIGLLTLVLVTAGPLAAQEKPDSAKVSEDSAGCRCDGDRLRWKMPLRFRIDAPRLHLAPYRWQGRAPTYRLRSEWRVPAMKFRLEGNRWRLEAERLQALARRAAGRRWAPEWSAPERAQFRARLKGRRPRYVTI